MTVEPYWFGSPSSLFFHGVLWNQPRGLSIVKLTAQIRTEVSIVSARPPISLGATSEYDRSG